MLDFGLAHVTPVCKILSKCLFLTQEGAGACSNASAAVTGTAVTALGGSVVERLGSAVCFSVRCSLYSYLSGSSAGVVFIYMFPNFFVFDCDACETNFFLSEADCLEIAL